MKAFKILGLALLLGACTDNIDSVERANPKKAGAGTSYCGTFSLKKGGCKGLNGNCVCMVTVSPGPRPEKPCSCNWLGVASNKPVYGDPQSIKDYFNSADYAELFTYLATPEYSELLDYLRQGPYSKKIEIGDTDYILFAKEEAGLAGEDFENADVVLTLRYPEAEIVKDTIVK